MWRSIGYFTTHLPGRLGWTSKVTGSVFIVFAAQGCVSEAGMIHPAPNEAWKPIADTARGREGDYSVNPFTHRLVIPGNYVASVGAYGESEPILTEAKFRIS